MLLIRNIAATSFTADAAQIPFDTTVLSTNDNLVLKDNSVNALSAGVYDTVCQVEVTNTSSSAAATVTLSAYADGKAIPGAVTSATIGASGQAALVLPWATKVVDAASGTAKLSWYLSGGAVSMTGAIARIQKVI